MNVKFVLDWVQHNWVLLLLLPGNILAVEAVIRQSAVKRGYKGIVSLCDRVADVVGFIGDIIAGLISRKPTMNGTNPNYVPPTGNKSATVVIILFLLCGAAQADVSVLDTIKAIPGLKSGVMYSWQTNQFIAINTVTATTVTVASVPVDLGGGLMRTDGLVGTATIDVGKLNISWLKLPILNYVNNLNVGYGIGYENLTTGSTTDTSRNKFSQGVVLSGSWKF